MRRNSAALPQTLVLLGAFACCTALSAESAPPAAEVLDGFKNPLDGVVISVVDTLDSSKGKIIDLMKESGEYDPSLLESEYTYFISGKNMHWREKYKAFDNVRDVYVKGDSVYITDSVNPHDMEIRCAKENMPSIFNFRDTYFALFEKAKNVLKSGAPDIEVSVTSKGDYCVTWQEDGEANMLVADKALAPKEFVQSYSDGKPSMKILVERRGAGFALAVEHYTDGGELFCKADISIMPVENSDFPRNFEPSNFGYREVSDFRSGAERKYIAVDKLPPESVINGLFANPDDVARYNREMSRFSPVKCDVCKEHKYVEP